MYPARLAYSLCAKVSHPETTRRIKYSACWVRKFGLGETEANKCIRYVVRNLSEGLGMWKRVGEARISPKWGLAE